MKRGLEKVECYINCLIGLYQNCVGNSEGHQRAGLDGKRIKCKNSKVIETEIGPH